MAAEPPGDAPSRADLGDLPYENNVDLPIVMDAFVAHSGDLLPGNLGILGTQFRRKLFGRFTHDGDAIDHCSLGLKVSRKADFVHILNEFHDCLPKFMKINEIGLIAIHRSPESCSEFLCGGASCGLVLRLVY